jgi:hypothetical protein
MKLFDIPFLLQLLFWLYGAYVVVTVFHHQICATDLSLGFPDVSDIVVCSGSHGGLRVCNGLFTVLG